MIADINDLDLIISLDPRLRMRKDVDRIFIFPLNPFTYHEEHKRLFIRSSEAVLIALFDGNKCIHDVIRDLSFLIDIPWAEASTIIRNFISGFKQHLVIVTQKNHAQVKRYDPIDYIIPRKNTDLSSRHPKLPEVVMFIPTFTCDFNCKYCYAPRNSFRTELSLDSVSMFLAQLRDWRLPTLFFSGGDPFASPRIRDLIELCCNHQLLPIIPTKTILTNSDIDFLTRNQINELQISIDTLSDRTANALISSADNYIPRLLECMENLISGGIAVNVNAVVTACNIRSIPDLIERTHRMGVKQITLSPYARSRYHHDDNLFSSLDDYQWLDDQIRQLKEIDPGIAISFKYQKDHTFMTRSEKEAFYINRPECTAGKNGLIILPDGCVTICETLYYEKDLIIGDLQQGSLRDIWFSAERQKLLFHGEEILAAGPCATCDAKVSCYREKGKCYVRALQSFGDPRMPDPYCPRSTGGKRIV